MDEDRFNTNSDSSVYEVGALENILLTVGSALDLDDVLEKIVNITATTVGADDSFIYLYDDENEEVLLYAATKGKAYAYKGDYRLPLGQGVTGYVALTRKAYLISKNLLQDPRFIYTPDLGESDYQSMLCLPIISKNEKLIGVVSIYSSQVNHFQDEHIRMAKSVALLVAGALENAQLYEATNRRAYVLEQLSNLSVTSTSGLSTSKILDMVTELVADLLISDLSVMLITDLSIQEKTILKSSARAEDQAARKKLNEIRMKLLKMDEKIRQGRLTRTDAARGLHADLKHHFHGTISVPISIGNEPLGYLQCYRYLTKRYTKEDQSILHLIANQIALVIKNTLLTDQLEQRNEIFHFFRDIETGHFTSVKFFKQAKLLGIDPMVPHVFIVAHLEGAYSEVESSEENGTIVLRELSKFFKAYTSDFLITTISEQVVILVSAFETPAVFKQKFAELHEHLKSYTDALLTIGISEPTLSIEDYSIALTEARKAMSIGKSVYKPGAAYCLQDVSDYLYLSQIDNRSEIRDPNRQKIEKIAAYDSEKGTSLLGTLTAYLEFSGNINEICGELYIHRNTLYQRINKITEISGIDLSGLSQTFPLHLALKVFQMSSNMFDQK